MSARIALYVGTLIHWALSATIIITIGLSAILTYLLINGIMCILVMLATRREGWTVSGVVRKTWVWSVFIGPTLILLRIINEKRR
jgi:hypothetical protein